MSVSAPVGRRRMLAGLLVLSCTVAGLLAAPAPIAAQPSRSAPLKVVATTAMIADAARAIGGDRVQAESLFGEGVDPHLYKPTRADTAKLLGADLILANGLNLEGQFTDTFAQLRRTKTLVLVGEQLPRERLLADPEFPDKMDPHVWMDPDLWIGVVNAVRDALVAKDPSGQGMYEQGHAAYTAQIRRMGDYARRALSSIPADQRVLVTAHDAFNYFARAYGFEVVGIQGVSTESEAGLQRIEQVVDLVVRRKVPAIFVEASVSDRNIQAVIEGAARRGHVLKAAAEIFSDSMGPPGSYEGTYLGMIDHNATTITRALGGEAPERGLANRLATAG